MCVDLHVRGYISACVDRDMSCQRVLERKAPLRQLDLEWKGACWLCWQDTGVSHDRWPEQGREDPLRSAVPERCSRCHRAHTSHSRMVSPSHTYPLWHNTVWQRCHEGTGARPPVPILQRATEGGTCHRTQVCSPTQRGMESSSATLPSVWETSTTEWKIQGIWLGYNSLSWTFFFFFSLILLFLLLGPDREFGCRPGFGIFPRAEGFSHWYVQWGSSCICTQCFSEAMNQQFNYALFRKFPHHIALGKVFPLFYIYISKTYIYHLKSPTIFSFWIRPRKPRALLGLVLSYLPFPLTRRRWIY